MKNRTSFIKPSHPLTGEPQLNPVEIGNNIIKGIETTLVLDTNILIAMEKVVKYGNKRFLLKEYGLNNLIKLLQRCPPKSVCISPGISLNEMPPGMAEKSRVYYEEFCRVHLPGFIDAPNSVHKVFSGKERDYGYLDLEKHAQAILAIPFVSLMYLIVIDNRRNKPNEKFREYLNWMETKLDILSAKEIEIAKYCFAEPTEYCKTLINIRRVLRKNFLKTDKNKLPRNFKEIMKLAFNGACDLHLINAANIVDENEIDGIKQDCWIATQDKKLVEFSKIFNYINIDGEAGKIAVTTIFEEQSKDDYWIKVNSEHHSLLKKRSIYHNNRDLDINYLIKTAQETINNTRLLYENT